VTVCLASHMCLQALAVCVCVCVWLGRRTCFTTRARHKHTHTHTSLNCLDHDVVQVACWFTWLARASLISGQDMVHVACYQSFTYIRP
jgi:hypothetical protein